MGSAQPHASRTCGGYATRWEAVQACVGAVQAVRFSEEAVRLPQPHAVQRSTAGWGVLPQLLLPLLLEGTARHPLQPTSQPTPTNITPSGQVPHPRPQAAAGPATTASTASNTIRMAEAVRSTHSSTLTQHMWAVQGPAQPQATDWATACHGATHKTAHKSTCHGLGARADWVVVVQAVHKCLTTLSHMNSLRRDGSTVYSGMAHA